MTRTEVIERLKATYIAKNHDYGNSAHVSFVEFGEVALVIRIADKLSRLQTLLSGKEAQVSDESVADTIGDAITYLCMLVAELDTEQDGVSFEVAMAATDNVQATIKRLDELATYECCMDDSVTPELFRDALLRTYRHKGQKKIGYIALAFALLEYHLYLSERKNERS